MTHCLETVAEVEQLHFEGLSNRKVAKDMDIAVSTMNRWVNNFLTTGTFGPVNLNGSNYAIDEHAELILVLFDEKLDIPLKEIQNRLDKDCEFQCSLRTISQFLDR